jgi:hypothetical protein
MKDIWFAERSYQPHDFLLLVEHLPRGMSVSSLNCMALVTASPSSILLCCHEPAHARCQCCGRPICERHLSQEGRRASFEQDETPNFALCEPCIELPSAHIYALCHLREQLNR